MGIYTKSIRSINKVAVASVWLFIDTHPHTQNNATKKAHGRKLIRVFAFSMCETARTICGHIITLFENMTGFIGTISDNYQV